MNGKKTRDFYYLQLQNLSNFDESKDLDAINKCIKSARVSHTIYYINHII